LCNVLNPTALIIGGELSAAGTALTLGIREAIDRNSQRVIADAVTITTSAGRANRPPVPPPLGSPASLPAHRWGRSELLR
jgi:hypothetical protein